MSKKPLVKDRRGDYWWVDTRKIVEEEGFNRRESYGDIPKLAREIKAAGLDNLEPLTCYRKGELWIVLKGHRRIQALRILEKEGQILLVRIVPPGRHFNKEDMILDQITGNEGLRFSPWEKAKVLRDLRGLGWSEEDIQKKSGFSDTYVRRLLSLADAPQKLINLVREGRVTGTLAMDTIAEGKVAELIEKGENNQLPLDDDREMQLFPDPAIPASPRITRSDLHRPASFKKVNKWAAAIDENILPPAKKEAYILWRKWLDGALTEDDFINFFQ